MSEKQTTPEGLRQAVTLAYVRALMDWERTHDPRYEAVIKALRAVYFEEVDLAGDVLREMAGGVHERDAK